MNNLEKLGGHFLETEVQQWHCSLGGKVIATVALFSGEGDEPSCTVDHNVITKHKGGPRCHHQTQGGSRCHHQTQGRGGDDEIEKSCLCNPSFQPYSTTKNIKPYARANLNCGPELPSTQTRTTNGNWMQEQLLLHFMRKKSYNSDRTKVPVPYLIYASPHELHTTFEVQELDWLRKRKKTTSVGVRETGDWSTREHTPWNISQIHTVIRLQGTYWLDLLAVQARKVWFLLTAGLSLALYPYLKQYCIKSSSSHCACLYVNHC